MYYLIHCWEDKAVWAFAKDISLKVNVIAQLEFGHYNVTVQHVSNYAMETPLLYWLFLFIDWLISI